MEVTEERIVDHKDLPQDNIGKPVGSGFLVFFAVLFAAIAIILSWVGIDTLYNDGYQRKVVGGDAYNFIIYATRGTAWVCAGVVSGLLANTCAVLSR